MRPRRRQVTVALTVLVAAVSIGSLTGASAAPSARTAGHRAGIPPFKKGSNAATLVDGKASVHKLRTTVTLPRVLLHAYANETTSIVGKVLNSSTPSWAVTHKGKHPRYGVLPVAHTTVLGFGSIPITASLHLNQVVRNGTITPITVKTSGLIVPPFKRKPAVVTGLLNVRVSNVKVDQVPAHVGPNCHTVTPLKLRLVGHPPGYDLFTGGPLSGKQTIPPFVGCGIHGDNLDPLLTGMISGPGNLLRMQQGNLGTWDQKKPSDCKGCHPPKHG
jgi:hypothetical protein